MKYTRTDMIKVLTSAGIEREKAGGIALAVVAAMANALTVGKVINSGAWNAGTPGTESPSYERPAQYDPR